MHAATRPYVIAGTALAAAGLVVVTPVASRLPGMQAVNAAVRLTSGSIFDVPLNLLYDFANIPYNEVQALDTAAGSLFLSGNWWVTDSTNIWGIDPGDTTHVASVLGVLPFPALVEGNGGLDYQVDGLLAAELPVSADCDAETCYPMTPPDVITGSTSWDRNLGFLGALTGQNNDLISDWFKVPLSDLFSPFKFDSATDPAGIIDPSGSADFNPVFGFPLNGASTTNPFEGSTGPGDAMPWDNTTYQLNPFQPFENFYNSLLATPSTDGIAGADGVALAGTGIELPTGTDLFQALQSVAAGLVIDFDPYVAGSPACPAMCDIPTSDQIPALVQDIENWDSSNPNPMIEAWLAGLQPGTLYPSTTAAYPDDIATQTQTYDAIALLQTGIYNLTPEQLANVDNALASINPELPALLTNAGIYTDPGYLAWTQADLAGTANVNDWDPIYGGYNPDLVLQDLLTMAGDTTNYSALSDPNVISTLLDPTAGDPGLLAALDPAAASAIDPSTLTADLTTMMGGLDPTALSADLSTELSSVLGSFGAQLSPDIASMLLNVF